jgi:hypothetical protein
VLEFLYTILLIDEKRKRFEKKLSKEGTGEATNNEANSTTSRQADGSQNSEESEAYKSKHPLFDRKTKVVGNDTFLKQIFS